MGLAGEPLFAAGGDGVPASGSAQEPRWFYLACGEPRGPVSREELLPNLLALPIPAEALVRREGEDLWDRASAMAELRGWIPKPGSLPRNESGPLSRLTEIEAVARHHRRLPLLVVLALLLFFLFWGTSLVFWQLYVALTVLSYLTSSGFQLARGLHLSLPAVWALAVCLPGVNLLALVVLHRRAKKLYRKCGLRSGILAPNQESLEEFRRSFIAEVFS